MRMRSGGTEKGNRVKIALPSLAAAAALLLPGCAAPRGARPAMPEPGEIKAAAAGGELEDLRNCIARALERYDQIRDYRCVFQSRQRIGGTLRPPQRILLKFMKPMSVYMKWIAEPHKGQEVLYVPSRYGPRGLARAGGWEGRLLPVIPIDVDGYWVMRDNIHPLNHVGLGYFLDLFDANYRRARAENAGALIDHGEDTVAGRPARGVEAVLPAEKSRGYYCYRCIVWFDEGHGLPVKIHIYDWDNNLVEEYVYENLEPDAGLSDRDFDRGNREYHF